MRDKEGMKFDCIFEEPLDFIDINYTHLNKTIRYEKRPHGEWITVCTLPIIQKCSNCKVVRKGGIEVYNFCPNCGSDNRKKPKKWVCGRVSANCVFCEYGKDGECTKEGEAE